MVESTLGGEAGDLGPGSDQPLLAELRAPLSLSVVRATEWGAL